MKFVDCLGRGSSTETWNRRTFWWRTTRFGWEISAPVAPKRPDSPSPSTSPPDGMHSFIIIHSANKTVLKLTNDVIISFREDTFQNLWNFRKILVKILILISFFSFLFFWKQMNAKVQNRNKENHLVTGCLTGIYPWGQSQRSSVKRS